MKQGLLAFQYEQEKGFEVIGRAPRETAGERSGLDGQPTGMTGLSGLMTYVELMQAAGLRSSVERHVRLRERGQGWTDSQMIISLMLLGTLAGGESVSDLDLLEKDRGLCRMLREFETCGMRLSERRALDGRDGVVSRRAWSRQRCGKGEEVHSVRRVGRMVGHIGLAFSVPSESAVFRYLERFHEVDEASSIAKRVGDSACQARPENSHSANRCRPSKTAPETVRCDHVHRAFGHPLKAAPNGAMKGRWRPPLRWHSSTSRRRARRV